MYGEYAEDVLEKLHEAELAILRDVNDICERHDIKYFVISGTAIGAVRHRGFIPWDDDIDLAMLRPEYEKFIRVVREEFPDKYEMMGPGFDNKNYNLLDAICRKGTVFANEAAWAAGMEPGISLDVFIYDSIPEDQDEALKLIKKVKKYVVLYQARKVHFLKLVSTRKTAVDKLKFTISGLLGIFLRLIPGEDRRLEDRYIRAIRSYEGQTQRYSAICDPGASYMDIHEDEIYPYQPIPFEDTYVWMINKYDDQIKRHMGKNYMELPPENKRTNHFPRKLSFGE